MIAIFEGWGLDLFKGSAKIIKKREKNLSESAKVKNRSKNLYLELSLDHKSFTKMKNCDRKIHHDQKTI